MVLPLTGTVAVENGLDTFTWTGVPLTVLNCVVGAAIVIDGRGYFVKTLTDTTSGTLTRSYAEATASGVAAEIEQLSPEQVQTATLNRRASDLFAELSLLTPNWDAQVGTLPERAQYDDEWMAESGRPFAVLVSDVGDGTAAIYSKASPTNADWSEPAPFSGPVGPTVTFDMGEVTTLPAGSSATASVTPVSGGYELNLGLTKGDQGIQGIQGIQGEVGQSLAIDASGSLAGRAAYDNEAVNFVYVDDDAGHLYILQSVPGGWSDPITFTAGPAGLDGSTITTTDGVGDGGPGPYTLASAPLGLDNILSVTISGVAQYDFTVLGPEITFGIDVPVGVPWQVKVSGPLSFGVPSDGTVTADSITNDSTEQEAIRAKLGAITEVTADSITDDPAEQAAIRAKLGEMPLPMGPSLLFLEQFLTELQGSGQTDNEIDGVSGEEAIVGTNLAGASSITVATPGNYDVAGHISIKHDNGRYWNYFITDITSGTVSFVPKLKWDASAVGGASVSRTMYNKAHRGKYAVRARSNRLALTPLYEMAVPHSHFAFKTRFVNNGTDPVDTLTPLGGATINYYTESSSSRAGSNRPVRFTGGTTAYIGVSAAGDGAKTGNFYLEPFSEQMLRLTGAITAGGGASPRVRVYANTSLDPSYIDYSTGTNIDLLLLDFEIPDTGTSELPVVFSIPFKTVATTSYRIEFVAGSTPASTRNLLVSDVSVFPLVANSLTLADMGSVRIVLCGDSNVAGDEGTSPEREALDTQLRIDLPDAIITNRATGGAKISDVIDNWATIAADQPHIVVCEVGTNDSYSPWSGAFEPNSTSYFAQMYKKLHNLCLGIGATLLILGPPALAESDGALVSWSLNDRAMGYNRTLWDSLAQLVIERFGTSTSYFEMHKNGTLECFHEGVIDMTSLDTQDIYMPKTASTLYPIVGSATLKSVGSSTSYTAHASAALRVVNTAWTYTVTAAGSITNETLTFWAKGRWK